MKKVWKILISLVLVLIAGTGGAAYYFFKMKTYDIADKKVGEVTKTEFAINLPGEDSEVELVEEPSEKETNTTGGENRSSNKPTSIVINAKAANITKDPKVQAENQTCGTNSC